MKILIYEGPKRLKVADAPDLDLEENQIRIQTLFSGISSGTEMDIYRGLVPFFRKKNDRNMHLFMPADKDEIWHYPIRSCDPGVWFMGYANIGKVVETGAQVSKIRVGDLVYSYSSHQSQLVKNEDEVLKLPDHANPERGIFLTNIMATFNGILDTDIRLGDSVVISGLGVLGQLAVQMAKLSGAFRVFGIDLFDKRLAVARENGADYTYNASMHPDIARAIRLETGNKGPDSVIEASGSYQALRAAIRIAAPDTTVTTLGWYQGYGSELDLSEEFHHNRISIRSSQAGGTNPAIRHMWDGKRKEDTCLKLLDLLKLDNLITHRIPYEHIAEAYEMIDQNPSETIQVLVTY
jgi:threonine dehydrogenase-like Zn-dependent dehydrogenase